MTNISIVTFWRNYSGYDKKTVEVHPASILANMAKNEFSTSQVNLALLRIPRFLFFQMEFLIARGSVFRVVEI